MYKHLYIRTGHMTESKTDLNTCIIIYLQIFDSSLEKVCVVRIILCLHYLQTWIIKYNTQQ